MLNHSLVPVGSTGYDIPYSARFNDDDSAYLSRTPSVAGNRKTWTWSGWVKRTTLGSDYIFTVKDGFGGTPATYIGFRGDAIRVLDDTGSTSYYFDTPALYRDTSAWYHIVVAVDTTSATSTDRFKLYVNGERATVTFTAPPPLNHNTALNSAIPHHLFREDYYSGTAYHDGYLAEVNFVDGQALTPSDFGETDETYGHWKPKKYTGTYGTNGFYLDFKNSGSLGADVSGNSNNWTPTNLAATDQMLDSPTNNFATLNPLAKSTAGYFGSVAEGNLRHITSGSGYGQAIAATQVMESGKWYMEVMRRNLSGHTNSWGQAYVIPASRQGEQQNSVSNASSFGGVYFATSGSSGASISRAVGSNSSGLSNPADYDVWQVAVDADAGKVWFGFNNTWYESGNPSTGANPSADWFDEPLIVGSDATDSGTNVWWNFGQDSSFAGNKTAQGNSDDNGIGDFYYTPPTGYLALCTQNLPEPTVVPSEHFNTVTYSGNGGTQSISVGFQPGLFWNKSRNNAWGHRVLDELRDLKVLYTSDTSSEQPMSDIYDFTSTGISFTGDSENVNSSSSNYVAWNWKANGAGVTNTDGSITSTVSANVDAGFSIVSYTGTGANATVGHGLSSSPEMIIVKNRDIASDWCVYHSDNTSAPETDIIYFNKTNATADDNTYWNDTAPTSSVFTVSTRGAVNGNTNNHIAYAFHSVDGYSKVGSYTGNGSTTDGSQPFVYTGFRPAWLMLKRVTGGTEHWYIVDNKRNTYNVVDNNLKPNSSNAEETGFNLVGFTSNGFKIRTTDTTINYSGSDFIYIAFAETPFKYTNAR